MSLAYSACNVVARHSLVERQQVQLVKIVLAQLGLFALGGPFGRDRSDPVEGPQTGLQRGRRHESPHRVNAPQEARSFDHLKVLPGGQRQQAVPTHEQPRGFEIALGLVDVGLGQRMAERNLAQHLRMVTLGSACAPCSGNQFRWSGPAKLEHPRPHGAEGPPPPAAST